MPLRLQHRRRPRPASAIDTQDWSQRLAQQHALLIGGTGYQYGDTDFLEYSERLYLGIAQRLREGPTSGDGRRPWRSVGR